MGVGIGHFIDDHVVPEMVRGLVVSGKAKKRNGVDSEGGEVDIHEVVGIVEGSFSEGEGHFGFLKGY
jgi:hypothetical protein